MSDIAQIFYSKKNCFPNLISSIYEIKRFLKFDYPKGWNSFSPIWEHESGKGGKSQ